MEKYVNFGKWAKHRLNFKNTPLNASNKFLAQSERLIAQ